MHDINSASIGLAYSMHMCVYVYIYYHPQEQYNEYVASLGPDAPPPTVQVRAYI